MTATFRPPECACRGCARHAAPASERCWRCLDKGCPDTLVQRIVRRIRRNDSKGTPALDDAAGAVVPVPGTRAVGRDGASPKDAS